MKKVRHKIKIGYTLLILIATLFMGIGYAKVNDLGLNIAGTIEANLPKEVLISDVRYSSNNEADKENSKINHYTGTMLDSQIVLGNSVSSTITYQIDIYNNTNEDHMFIGVITNKSDENLYSNANIGFTVTELQDYVTVIKPKETITFEITFKYEGSDISNNILTSKLNFRFLEIPKLELSNDGNTYVLDKMYPGFTEEYEFTISNYDNIKTNNVPMTYFFETSMESGPLTAKIYDKKGNEITNGITIEGDGATQTTHEYVLKIKWDNSSGESIKYADYENKQYKCNVMLKAMANDSEKYLDYKITKQFNLDISVASFNINADAQTNINMEKEAAVLTLTLNNYGLESEYNIFNTEYEVSIEGNDKFTLSVDGQTTTDNLLVKILSGGQKTEENIEIRFLANINNLNLKETVNLKIKATMPYAEEIILPITISLQPATVILEYGDELTNSSTITVYKGKTYSTLPNPTWSGHTFNGWYSAEEGGTKFTTEKEVTTTETHTLYAQWTSHMLVDNVKIGDYISYDVGYNNVGTNPDGAYIPQDSYTGWRVMGFGGSGKNGRYVKLVTTGIPMTFVHNVASVSTSVTNMTTNFFGTSINATSTNYRFRKCGFYSVNSSGTKTTITTIGNLSTLFSNNTYTQINSNVPAVQGMTKTDLDKAMAFYKGVDTYTTENGEYLTAYNLLAIPSKDVSGQYAAYHLGSSTGNYLWNVRYLGAIIYTNGEHGVRPVVSLKTNIIKKGGTGTSSDPYQMAFAT